MKKTFCIALALLVLLTACGLPAAPQPPVLRFQNTPVVLTQGELVLRGRLAFAGTDGARLKLETPDPAAGGCFSLLGGVYSVTYGDVTLQVPANGCIYSFLRDLHRTSTQCGFIKKGLWGLPEHAEVFLTADENGTPLKLWNEKENWAAEFF